MAMELHCGLHPLNLQGERNLFLENEPRTALSSTQFLGPKFALSYSVNICPVASGLLLVESQAPKASLCPSAGPLLIPLSSQSS